jgi:hypothetical protein
MRDTRTVHERIADDGLVLKALNAGARNALLEHQRAGNPVCEWKDGMIVWVPPAEIFNQAFLPTVEAVSDFTCSCGKEFQVHRTANGNGTGPYSVACPNCGRQHEIPSSPVRIVPLPGPKKYALD